MAQLRVLVVDDDPSILEWFEQYLVHRGDEYRLAPDGPDALKILDEFDADVLITDIQMPQMNGLELVRRVKPLRPYLAAVVLTGVGTRSDTIEAIKQGVFDFLEKPIGNLSAFDMVVDRAGERSQLMRQRDGLMERLKEQNAHLAANLNNLNEAYDKLMRQDAELHADLARAQRMQQHMLPDRLPTMGPFDFYAYYCPCEMLGGDFFGRIPLGEDRAALYLADVSGHGVGAAMVTVIIREMIHTHLNLSGDATIFERPELALDFFNRGLRAEPLDPPLHVTMSYLVIDAHRDEIEYAAAGHPPLALLERDKSAELRDSGGPALGLEPAPIYQARALTIGEHATLMVYSDGLSEARNIHNQELSLEDLAGVSGNGALQSARELGQRIEALLFEHLQGIPPADDVSFLAIHRRAQPNAEADDERNVKIVMLEASRADVPTSPADAYVAQGWTTNALILRLVGRVTWKQGPVFQSLVDKARARGMERTYLDLSHCLSLDSTMLGLIHQAADAVVICDMKAHVAEQMRELGILDHLQVSAAPAPEATFTVAAGEELGAASHAEMMLDAHEDLIQLSEDNQRRFSDVVAMLRRNLNQ